MGNPLELRGNQGNWVNYLDVHQQMAMLHYYIAYTHYSDKTVKGNLVEKFVDKEISRYVETGDPVMFKDWKDESINFCCYLILFIRRNINLLIYNYEFISQ